MFFEEFSELGNGFSKHQGLKTTSPTDIIHKANICQNKIKSQRFIHVILYSDIGFTICLKGGNEFSVIIR